MADTLAAPLPLTSSLSLTTTMASSSATRVQVSVRVRPPNKHDTSHDKVAVEGHDNQVLVSGGGDDARSRRSYTFDHVFTGDQASVFDAIGRSMLREAYDGFNVCLFAYGQTGSGKTYSVFGEPDDDERAGLAPRFARCLFDEAQRLVEEDADLTVRVTLSMIEVYMEKVRDLLAPRTRGQEPESLDIREDAQHRVYVKGAGVHPVLGYERMMELLRRGNASRQTAETRMNETSSRSHAILQISVVQEYKSVEKKDLESVVTLVDLAGSERQSKAESSGQHFEEAKKINHSLLMLGRALNAFSERRGTDAYISLRESKLTRLLSESFGGNSKTWMLATVSPSAYNLSETVSTLEYASNAMAITNKARVNKTAKDLEYDDLLRLRAVLDSFIARESALIESYEMQCTQADGTAVALKRELDALYDAKLTEDMRTALSERARLMSCLYSTLCNNGAAASREALPSTSPSSSAVVAYTGMCTTSLAMVTMGTYEPITLVLPLYNLSGPPPLLQCYVHLDKTADGDVLALVQLHELQYIPDFVNAGVQATLWFEGESASRVSTALVPCSNNSATFAFQQTYMLGRMTNELQRYMQSRAVHVQVDGYLAAPTDVDA